MRARDSVRHVLFDLDETMYRKDTGIMDLISERINEYMSLRLGIDPVDVAAIRQRYYREYGTTGRGLFLHYDLDLDDYFEFVHDLPIEEVLRPDRRLDGMLEGLNAEKTIFTNATAQHAQRVLRVLGVARHFGQIMGITELQYVPKPDIRAYHRVLEVLGAKPEECLLVDDRVRNLRPGQSLGMTTVLVGDDAPDDGVDYVVDEVTDIGKVVEIIRCPGGDRSGSSSLRAVD